MIWFDAHADFNTPETTTSGFLDGNAVAILTGRCWKRMGESIGLDPIPDNHICLIGTRDVDTLEAELLEGSRIDVVTQKELRTKLARVLAQIAEHVDDAYVHLDLDVLDAEVAAVNSYSVKGGLSVEEVQYALDLIKRQFRVVGVTLSAYDPSVDSNGAGAKAAIELVKHAASVATAS